VAEQPEHDGGGAMSMLKINSLVLLMAAIGTAISVSGNFLLLNKNEQLAYDLTACKALKMELNK
jgi:hypothetical protein